MNNKIAFIPALIVSALALVSCSDSVSFGPEAHHHDVERHPKCTNDDEGYAESVAMAVDMEAGYQLDNIQIIDDVDQLWVGASVMDGEEMKSRSEVWLIDENNVMWGISGNAPEYAGVPKSSDHIMLEEYASGVDACTVVESGFLEE